MLEINTKNFNNIETEFNNQNNLLSLLEKANYEKDQAINTLNNYQSKYRQEIQDYNNMKESYSSMEQNLFDIQQKNKIFENKLSQNIDNLLETERKLNCEKNKNEILLKENSIIKNQLSYFENAFNNMKRRKNEENEELKKELEEIKEEKDELKTEKNNLILELNELKTKNKFLTQENNIIKDEAENLKKILNENSEKVKISDEKINSIDNMINLYKTNNDDLKMEIERIKLAKKLEKEESNKLIQDFQKTLKERDAMFESESEKIKKNYEQELNTQLEENQNLQAEIIGLNMEIKNYKGERDLAIEENKKLSEQIEEQKIKMMQMMKATEDNYMRQIYNLKQRLRINMMQKLDENENNELNKENNIDDKNIFNEKLAKNGEEVYKELLELKKENEKLKRENDILRKENEKLKKGENDLFDDE